MLNIISLCYQWLIQISSKGGAIITLYLYCYGIQLPRYQILSNLRHIQEKTQHLLFQFCQPQSIQITTSSTSFWFHDVTILVHPTCLHITIGWRDRSWTILNGKLTVRAITYLLCCYQHLEKFNAIMCAKYHNHPLLTWFIRANIVTSATVVSGQRPRLTLTFFCTLLCYFSVVLYKWVL